MERYNTASIDLCLRRSYYYQKDKNFQVLADRATAKDIDCKA